MVFVSVKLAIKLLSAWLIARIRVLCLVTALWLMKKVRNRTIVIFVRHQTLKHLEVLRKHMHIYTMQNIFSTC